MSEKEKIKKEKTEETQEQVEDSVTENVALLKSKIITLEKLAEDLTDKLAKMTNKYLQAKEFVDNDAKAELLADIGPRYSLPKELLILKTKDELMAIKKILDKAEVPSFKAGTPLTYERKPTARQELDNMFEKHQAKLRGDR